MAARSLTPPKLPPPPSHNSPDLTSDHVQPVRRNGAAICVLMSPARRRHDKHRPCQTLVGLTRPSTSFLRGRVKDVDARHKATAVRFIGSIAQVSTDLGLSG